ncbi:hypothetical protein HK098_000743 [Nowakowskiella sp. JEL0407]|nr:hypothetical protein HK098_000743 [Nowakowskiella sp. JEL0407]
MVHILRISFLFTLLASASLVVADAGSPHRGAKFGGLQADKESEFMSPKSFNSDGAAKFNKFVPGSRFSGVQANEVSKFQSSENHGEPAPFKESMSAKGFSKSSFYPAPVGPKSHFAAKFQPAGLDPDAINRIKQRVAAAKFKQSAKNSFMRPSEYVSSLDGDGDIQIKKKVVHHFGAKGSGVAYKEGLKESGVASKEGSKGLPVEPLANSAKLSSKGAGFRAAHAKSFAAAADLTLKQLSKSEASSKGAKLTVDTFQSPHAYRAGLEVYHASANEFSESAPFSKNSMKSAATGDIPADVKNTLNNITTPNQIIGTVQGLNWSTGTAGVILICTGLVMAFFGYMLFKVVLFIAGFLGFGALAYVGLNIIRNSFPSTAQAFTDNGAVIYFVVVLVVGALGGGLTVCLWRVGLSVIGGLLGFVVATTIQQAVDGGLIKSEVGRIVFIAIIVIIFAIAIHFLERPLLIIGTSVPGAYATIWGIDVFVQTGFKDAVVVVLQNAGKITVTTNVWIMIGAFLALSVIGILVQFFWSGKKHHHLGRSGYRNIEKEQH